MKKRGFISFVLAAVVAAGVGYAVFDSAFGQNLPPAGANIGTDGKTTCDPADPQCAAANEAGTAGSITNGVVEQYIDDLNGTNVTGGVEIFADDPGNPEAVDPRGANIIWLQTCLPCQINIIQQIRESGKKVPLEMIASSHEDGGACDQDNGEGGPAVVCPAPQCQPMPDGECYKQEKDDGPCTNGCEPDENGIVCPMAQTDNETPDDCWELKESANGCVKKPGCSNNEMPENIYPTVDINPQPVLWEWTGGCGDGTYGGMVRDVSSLQRTKAKDPNAPTSGDMDGDGDDDGEDALARANAAKGIKEGTNYEDLFPSMTGCYNPEERFTKPIGDASEDGPRRLAPDDARLTLHPRCVAGGAALQTNQIIPLTESNDACSGMADGQAKNDCYAGLGGGGGKGQIVTSDQDEGSFRPAHIIQCLHNDYIDDMSNFCRQYLSNPEKYQKDVWKLVDVTGEDSEAGAAGGCWTMVENQPAFLAPVPGEHYMPLGLFFGDAAFPDGQSYTARYGNMGQNGFGHYRIYDPSADPNGTWVTGQEVDEDDPTQIATGTYVAGAIRTIHPMDIYGYGGDVVGSLFYDQNWVGRKFKLQQCLKTYIEEYAHLGDCGQIVLPGAKPNITDSHCQWVTMARQDQNKTFLQMLFSIDFIQTAIETAMDLTLKGAGVAASTIMGEDVVVAAPKIEHSKRGLRSEYFDYQNFATAGWVGASPPIFGGQSNMVTDICTKKIMNGEVPGIRASQVFNTAKGLSFERRGCPTVIGPDTWPSFFSMSSCDFTRGALQFADGATCLQEGTEPGKCVLYDPTTIFYYQAFPPQVFPRNLALTTNIGSPISVIWWNGYRDGMFTPLNDIFNGDYTGALGEAANGFANMKPMLMNSVPAGNPVMQLPIEPPQDYVDPLWVSRTCMHDMWGMMMLGASLPYTDYWYETADWMPTFLKNLFQSDIQECQKLHIETRTCCGNDCGVGGINCDCWEGKGTNGRETDGDCGPLGAYSEYDYDAEVGQSYRDGMCTDTYDPTETVLGFPFFGGDMPAAFADYNWGGLMDIAGGLINVLPAFKLKSFGEYMKELGFSPGTIETMNNIQQKAVKVKNVVEDINEGVQLGSKIVQASPMINMAGMMLLGMPDMSKLVDVAGKVDAKMKPYWDSFYATATPILNVMQPNALLNAVGLGGMDIGCVVDSWAEKYQKDGLEMLEKYVTASYATEAAEKDPTYNPNNDPEYDGDAYPYKPGDGNNVEMPSKCLKTATKPNLPVVFSYHPNIMRFQDAQWCEFENPYLPHSYNPKLMGLDAMEAMEALVKEFTVAPIGTITGGDDPYDIDTVSPGVSYAEAAYNAAVSSIDGLTEFAAVRPGEKDAVGGLLRMKAGTKEYRWFRYMRAIYDPEPPDDVSKVAKEFGEKTVGYDTEDEPGFQMVERIRDGCGAFTQRASWMHDPASGLPFWLFNRNENRCQGWKGIYGRQYKDLKIVSWRLPRFNYEFLKAFIECTGPVYSRGPNVCGDGIDWIRVALNQLPCIDTNPLPSGTGNVPPCITIPPPAGPIPIPGNMRPTNFDDVTEYSEPWNVMGGTGATGTQGQRFGFWCVCPKDEVITTVCNESFCTCDAINFNLVPWPGFIPGTRCSPSEIGADLGAGAACGNLAALSINMCEGYGPFASWMQCYYQARAKACPVLDREISNGIPGSMFMQSDPNQMRTASGQFEAVSKQPAENVTAESICTGIEPKTSYENLRWNAEEPNILAHLPITAEFAARDQGGFYNAKKPTGIIHDIGFLKHRDLVFQSAVRDIQPPYLESTLPWPTSLDVPSQSTGLNSDMLLTPNIKKYDTELFMKAHDIENAAWAETRPSDLGGTDDKGRFHSDWPHPRATEAILGPRGCDIGGWYEMMLYQARCIRWFKLNCICDYRKTFVQGSAEAYVLLRGGMAFPTVMAYMDFGDIKYTMDRMQWPLMWRGFAGPDYAPPPRYLPNLENSAGASMTVQQLQGYSTKDLQNLVTLEQVIDTTLLDPITKRAVNKWEYANAGKKWKNKINKNGYTYDNGGLENAQPGDFMIYDEEILDASGAFPDEDARYPRHVAYIESVDKEKGIVTVSEMNWGKDLDSCGNTDRWGLVTKRRIYRDEANIDPALNCNNPDWLDCFEPNWYNLKIYRPTDDINNPDRPICFTEMDKKYPYEGQTINGEYALHLPEPFVTLEDGGSTRSLEVQFSPKGKVLIDKKKCTATDIPIEPIGSACGPMPVPLTGIMGLTPKEIYRTGAWKRSMEGMYDANEVAAFLVQRRGRCDPPHRTDFTPDYTLPTLEPKEVDKKILEYLGTP